jgi:hypothetical protein
MHFPIGDLARLSFPGRKGAGWFLMLEGYFDDSGTHPGSSMVVWGGVMGDSVSFAAMEESWLRLLAEPLPGKPRIKQFHLSHIARGLEEFRDYNEAERDLVTKAFRDVVIEAGLIPVSFSISVPAWGRHATPMFQALFRSPEHFAFMSCIMSAFRMARISNAPISMQFDTARLTNDRAEMIAACQQIMPDTVVNIGFSHVATLPALQAADMVAYEAYLLSNKAESEPGHADYSAIARPHFKRLLEGAPDAHGFILRDTEMKAFVAAIEGMLDRGLSDTPARGPGFQNIFDYMFSVGGV